MSVNALFLAYFLCDGSHKKLTAAHLNNGSLYLITLETHKNIFIYFWTEYSYYFYS